MKIETSLPLLARLPDCPENLIVRNFAPDERVFQWLEFDIQGGSKSVLHSDKSGLTRSSQGCQPRLLKSRGEIIFGGSTGIFALTLKSGVQHPLLALDDARLAVTDLWVSPSDEVFFIQSTRVSEARTERPSVKAVVSEYSLYRMGLAPTGTPKLLSRLSAYAYPIVPDWREKRLVGVRGKELIAFDLDTGKESSLGAVPTPADVELISGLASPVGDLVAFTRDNTLWLRRQDGEPEKVATLPNKTNAGASRPIWCECGMHLAVQLEASEERVLVAMDVAKKTLFLPDHSTVLSATMVWVPRG